MKVVQYDDDENDDGKLTMMMGTMMAMVMRIMMVMMMAHDGNGAKKSDATLVCDLTAQANDDRSSYFHKNWATTVNSILIPNRLLYSYLTFTSTIPL